MTVAITARTHPANYIKAVEDTGANAHVVVPPESLPWLEAGRLARQTAGQNDALLLSGGYDIHPAFYGQEPTFSENIDLARDILELCALDAFLALNKPVLGICRGIQVINVAFGGTLFQHIDGHSQTGGSDSLHNVTLGEYELCKKWGGTGTVIEVNSAHHQAIDRLGGGLFAWAASADGIVEAVAHNILPVIGFQWHPERHEKAYMNDIMLQFLCKL